MCAGEEASDVGKPADGTFPGLNYNLTLLKHAGRPPLQDMSCMHVLLHRG